MGPITKATMHTLGPINCAHCGTKMVKVEGGEHFCTMVFLDWLEDLKATKTGTVHDVIRLIEEMSA